MREDVFERKVIYRFLESLSLAIQVPIYVSDISSSSCVLYSFQIIYRITVYFINFKIEYLLKGVFLRFFTRSFEPRRVTWGSKDWKQKMGGGAYVILVSYKQSSTSQKIRNEHEFIYT